MQLGNPHRNQLICGWMSRWWYLLSVTWPKKSWQFSAVRGWVLNWGKSVCLRIRVRRRRTSRQSAPASLSSSNRQRSESTLSKWSIWIKLVSREKNTNNPLCREMKMANGQWPMANSRWLMANGRWPMADGRWPMADGQWPMADGQWSMANGKWPIADGRWPKADGR